MGLIKGPYRVAEHGAYFFTVGYTIANIKPGKRHIGNNMIIRKVSESVTTRVFTTPGISLN